ncbi:exonuclease domain-containing protein [Colwellia sp. E150_009]
MKGLSFLALDVETANEDMSSICQIGIAEVIDGEVVDSASWLIDPEDYFSPINTSIHGITKKDVKGCPPYYRYDNTLRDALSGKYVICHTHFDRVSMKKVAEKYGLPQIDCIWLDSAKITRRAWKNEFGSSGYGLANVCNVLGYEFQHHNAEEDAKAAAFIVIEASKLKNVTDIKEWLSHIKKPVTPSFQEKIKNVKGNEKGRLFGETIVFTGNLSLSKIEAAEKASNVGCNVSSSVTKKTTMLVVGEQDLSLLVGYSKSSKHRKAEELIEKGQKIEILSDTEFLTLIDNS